MKYLLTQLGILAQRGRDMDGWVNVLFIVVMTVLWAVGALIKGAGAKARRQGGQSQTKQPEARRETWQQRLARKVGEVQRAAEERSKQVAERMRKLEEKAQLGRGGRRDVKGPEPARPPAGRVTVHPGRGGEAVMVYEPGQRRGLAAQQRRAREAVSAARRQAPARRPREPKVAPTPETPQREPAVDGLSLPALSQAVSEPLRPRTEARAKGFEGGVIIDYSDPDALKKAILQYEILGRPLALRDPFERTAAR